MLQKTEVLDIRCRRYSMTWDHLLFFENKSSLQIHFVSLYSRKLDPWKTTIRTTVLMVKKDLLPSVLQFVDYNNTKLYRWIIYKHTHIRDVLHCRVCMIWVGPIRAHFMVWWFRALTGVVRAGLVHTAGLVALGNFLIHKNFSLINKFLMKYQFLTKKVFKNGQSYSTSDLDFT